MGMLVIGSTISPLMVISISVVAGSFAYSRRRILSARRPRATRQAGPRGCARRRVDAHGRPPPNQQATTGKVARPTLAATQPASSVSRRR